MPKHTKAILSKLAKESRSYSQIVKKLGFSKTGGSAHRHVRKLLVEYDIDVSHFTGQSWSKGLTGTSAPCLNRLSDNEIFCENSKILGTKLRRYYIKVVPDNMCSICKLTEWSGKPLKYHIDHINGVNNDNRKPNLRWICPNCHQQTTTWGWSKERSTKKI